MCMAHTPHNALELLNKLWVMVGGCDICRGVCLHLSSCVKSEVKLASDLVWLLLEMISPPHGMGMCAVMRMMCCVGTVFTQVLTGIV